MTTASTHQAVADGSLRLITLLIDAGADRNVTNKEGASPAQVCVCARACACVCVRACMCVCARLCLLSLAFRVRGERHTVFGKGV